MSDPSSNTSLIASILPTAAGIWASKAEVINAFPRGPAVISYLSGIRINILPAALKRIPESWIQEISRWVSYILSSISSLWSSVACSVSSFFSQLPGQILSSLKRTGIWLLLSPFRLIRWLWGRSGLGPKLVKAGAYGLWLLKWGAIGTVGLLGIVIAGTILFNKYNSNTGSDTSHPDKTFRGYGTVPGNTRPNIREDNPRSYRQGNNQEAASDGHRQREAKEEARRPQRGEREEREKREEREREERGQRIEREATSRRQKLESLSNAFEEWMKESEAIMGDRTKIRSIPQPRPTCATCDNSSCKGRMEEWGVTFCVHTMTELFNAYIEVKRLSVEEREGLLREQKKLWHPDRFTRCGEDVKENVQRVAEELMKVMCQIN